MGTTLIRGGAFFVVHRMIQIWTIVAIIQAVTSVKGARCQFEL